MVMKNQTKSMKGGNEKMENPNLEDKIKACIELIGKGKIDESGVREYNLLNNEVREFEQAHYRKLDRIEEGRNEYLRNVIYPRKDQRYTLDEIAEMNSFWDARYSENRAYSIQREELVKEIEEIRKPFNSVLQEYCSIRGELNQNYSQTLESIDYGIKNAEQKIKDLKHEKENADKTYKANLEKVDEKINALHELRPCMPI